LSKKQLIEEGRFNGAGGERLENVKRLLRSTNGLTRGEGGSGIVIKSGKKKFNYSHKSVGLKSPCRGNAERIELPRREQRMA